MLLMLGPILLLDMLNHFLHIGSVGDETPEVPPVHRADEHNGSLS